VRSPAVPRAPTDAVDEAPAEDRVLVGRLAVVKGLLELEGLEGTRVSACVPTRRRLMIFAGLAYGPQRCLVG
jgi:hypothetical protein